jgi:hypothetical protein
MNDAEFAVTQRQLAMLAGFATQLDLAGYAQRIAETEASGPTSLSPAVWEKVAPRLKQLRELASSLIPFQALAIEMKKQQAEDEKKPRIIIPGLNDG